MHYYRFLVFILSGGNVGVLKGTCIYITVALPEPYPDNCSEDSKLLKIISQKDEKLKDQEPSKILITEYKKIPEKVFKNKKTTITIKVEEWQ